jgi:hypothetical protein
LAQRNVLVARELLALDVDGDDHHRQGFELCPPISQGKMAAFVALVAAVACAQLQHKIAVAAQPLHAADLTPNQARLMILQRNLGGLARMETVKMVQALLALLLEEPPQPLLRMLYLLVVPAPLALAE